MRAVTRVLAVAALAAAAFGAGTPASARPLCADPEVPYVVTVHACAGTFCVDECEVGATVSCETYMWATAPCSLLPKVAS